MKVLHVYRTYFPDPPGGLQEAIRQISLATQTHGVESEIFTLSPNPHPASVILDEGRVIRAKSWAAPASCDLGGPGAIMNYRAAATRADVIHFHFPWPFADVLHLLEGRRKPSIMTYHSDVVRQQALGTLYGPLMRSTLRSMQAVVATSPAYAQTSAALGTLVAPARLKVIPLGMADYRETHALPLPRRAGVAPGEPFFLALGVLRYYKGLDILVKAARDIGAKIVIAGSGPEMSHLRGLVDTIGAHNVVFAGQVSHEEKVALLQHCHALVLSSHLRSEAFGMVLVEAAMFGKPLICCEIGSGTSYVNEHGVTGFVVAPDDPTALGDAMRALLSDPVAATRMGAAARERYERLFSGPALGKAYAALYREVTTR